MLTSKMKKGLRELESLFKSGKKEPARTWTGFDPRKNRESLDSTTVQRSLFLSYCSLVPQYLDLSAARALEIGVEKHRHVGIQLGLQNWERLDRSTDVGGNKIDYNFDFVDKGVPEELRGVFDVVLCCNTLEHTFDILTGFKNTFEFLRPGGLVYFSTPFRIKVHARPDYWRLTPMCYERILAPLSSNYLVLEENFKETLYGVSAFAVK